MFALQRLRCAGNVNSKSSLSGLVPQAEAINFCLFVCVIRQETLRNAESPELDVYFLFGVFQLDHENACLMVKIKEECVKGVIPALSRI